MCHSHHTVTLYPCGVPLPSTRSVLTRDLETGMRVLLSPILWTGRPVRTVSHVEETEWRNYNDEPLVAVHYVEPPDSDWGDVNGALWNTPWRVIDHGTA